MTGGVTEHTVMKALFIVLLAWLVAACDQGAAGGEKSKSGGKPGSKTGTGSGTSASDDDDDDSSTAGDDDDDDSDDDDSAEPVIDDGYGGDLPAGAVIFTSAADCPAGFKAYEKAQGRYLVAMGDV